MIKQFFLLMVFALSSLWGCAQSFEGAWKGSLTIQGIELPLIFELEYKGTWTGTMQSPMQSKTKIPLSEIIADADSIRITIKNPQISYRGKLSADRETIEGTFQQGSIKAPMQFKKQSPAELTKSTTFNRPQQVNPPYSYDTLDVTFENKIDQVRLAGTITSPREKGRFPAVVLVTGSGPQNRNSAALGHETFKVLANYLTKQGIVVLRYDDRGVGQSTGDYAKGTTGDFGKDALAALNFLRTQPKVNPKKVGVIGHSEGGLIATILAGQKVAGLDFIVSLAGPAIRIDSLMILQNQAVWKSVGHHISPEEIEMVKANYRIAQSELPTEKAFDEILANMKRVPGSQNADFGDQIAILVTPWYRHFLRIDPVPFIQKIKIPVFAGFGGKDVQVIAAQNMESMTDNLPKSAKNEIKIYPEMNHFFQKATTGAVSEYAKIDETINEEVLKDIATWIKKL